MHQVKINFKMNYIIINLIIFLLKDQLITNIVKLKTLEAYQTFIGKFKPRLPKNIIESPVKLNTIYGTTQPGFINYMAPG